ncbi:MAG: hypothetical protein ACI9WC_001235 [Arenicella sp.]|jgi:hypothetical protein
MPPFNDYLSGFCNRTRSRNREKILHWDRAGIVLWSKRLEKEKLKWPVGDLATSTSSRRIGSRLGVLGSGYSAARTT